MLKHPHETNNIYPSMRQRAEPFKCKTAQVEVKQNLSEKQESLHDIPESQIGLVLVDDTFEAV